MKAKIFNEVMGIINTVIPKRTMLPALTGVVVDEDTVMATNLDIWVRVHIPNINSCDATRIMKYGDIKALLPIIKKGNNVILSEDSVVVDDTKYKVGQFTKDQYPEFNCDDDMKVIAESTDISTLFILISLEKMAAEEDYRPQLNKVNLDFEKGNFVATDGHVLGLSPIKLEENTGSMMFWPIGKILSKIKNPISYRISYNEFYAKFDIQCNDYDVTIWSRRYVDGVYPPYERVIPTGNEHTITFSWETFEKMTDYFKKDRMVISIENDMATITSMDHTDMSALTVDMKCDEEKFRFGMNANFLRNVIEFTVGYGEVTMAYTSKDHAFLIKNDGRIGLIMPIHIKE